MGIHRWPVDSRHKGLVMRKRFHVIMSSWELCRRLVMTNTAHATGGGGGGGGGGGVCGGDNECVKLYECSGMRALHGLLWAVQWTSTAWSQSQQKEYWYTTFEIQQKGQYCRGEAIVIKVVVHGKTNDASKYEWGTWNIVATVSRVIVDKRTVRLGDRRNTTITSPQFQIWIPHEKSFVEWKIVGKSVTWPSNDITTA